MKDKLTSFFLNHGEKLGFGLIVVMALFVLSPSVTRWSPYKKSPQELVTEAEKADQKIKDSKWPKEREQELTPTKNILARAKALRGGVDSQQYAFSTFLYTPIYPRSEPILPPKFLTVESPIVDADVVLIETALKDESLEEGEEDGAKEEEKPDQTDVPEGLRRRPKLSASSPTEDGLLLGLGSGCGEGAVDDPTYGACGGVPDCPDGYMAGSGVTEKVSRNGEGFRFVAVRAVLDWAAQRREYARALHLDPSEAQRKEPKIINFEIQRQRALSEENPWSGEWETLDIEDSVNVLKKSIDIEADVVDVTVTNSVITEPLPVRVLGVWESIATHPRITNFVLSPEEQKREQIRIEKLRKVYEELKKNQAVQQPLEPGGFGKYQADIRSMQNELNSGGYSAYMEGYNDEYATEMRGMYAADGMSGAPAAVPGGVGAMGGLGAPGGAQPNLLTSARSAASGRLLLFRYFDFEVDPGAVYRYRIRIEYENPNYSKPIELLASPELAEGRTRTSEWSEPTPPVQVRPEAEFYLTGVEYESKLRDDVAVMDVYKWNAPTGTMVNELKRYAVGDEIGGIIKKKVVNPLDESYDVQEIKVNTGDLVIDYRKDDELKIDGDLPDLGKVPAGARFDEVLVMNSHGNLETYDRFTRESERVEAKQYQKFTDDIGREYEEAASKAAEGDDLLSIYGADCGGDGGGGGYGGSGSSRPRSASSKLRSRRRRSSGGGGCGGY